MMLMSQLAEKLCRFNRKNSRIIRLIRFRLTALPTFFVTVMPNRDRLCSEGEKKTMKCSFCIFRPEFASSINSFRFKILWAFEWEKRNGQAFRLETRSYDINQWIRMALQHIATRWIWAIRALYKPPAARRALSWQSNPSLGSSPVDDSSTLFGRHSLKKTMIPGPFDSAGLKCSFHFQNSLS